MQKQKPLIIRPGGYYVGRGTKSYLTRHVIHIKDDGERLCLWESYKTETGEATRDAGGCSEGHLYNWAEREATPEESARMVKTQPTHQEEHIRQVTQTILWGLSDETLRDELIRRGFTVSKTKKPKPH